MARGELLLELLSEEIPARMQRRAIDDLVNAVRRMLAEAKIPAKEIHGYVTPRRLTVFGEGIPERQPDYNDERRGPRIGAPQQALDGFLRAAGLQSIDECEVRDTGRGEFYFAVLRSQGQAASEVLGKAIHGAMMELPWPKTMRFPASELRWVRPLTSVVCLFDGKIVPLPLGDVPVGRTTRGHRFLSPGEIAVDNAADYIAKLEAAHVVLDQDRRRDLIAADLDRLSQAEGLTVKPDPGLLDEVTGLAEFPVVLIGRIDDASMELPPEVLATAMRTHQKYFSCLKPDGSPASRFLFVANNQTPDGGKTIVAGNERVLKARLADARFFWDQDRKIPLADRVDALENRIFHADLGTMLQKIRRMERLVEFLVERVPGAVFHLSMRAVRLAKADLSTGMVGEFPELQGVMGRYYALQGDENPRVADAIADHYRPLGPNDSCPSAPDTVVVALADKLDSLAAFFSIGEIPTGSRDPFALRRAAQGVIRLILENKLRIPLLQALHRIAEALGSKYSDEAGNATLFILDRLKVHLRESGVRHDFINAVRFPPGVACEDDLVRLLARVDALTRFLRTEDGSNLLIAYRRAANIVEIEEKRDDRRYDREVDRGLLQQQEELALFGDLQLTSSGATRSLAREEFEAAMGHLASMRRPVDEFFDKVTVNVEDKALRENRLRLLSRIRAVMNQVADFSQIEG